MSKQRAQPYWRANLRLPGGTSKEQKESSKYFSKTYKKSIAGTKTIFSKNFSWNTNILYEGHIYTTNWVESVNSMINRYREKKSGYFGSVE